VSLRFCLLFPPWCCSLIGVTLLILQQDVCQFLQNQPQWLFTENETNKQKLYGVQNDRPHVKDAFHDYVIQGNHGAVNPKQQGMPY